MIDKNEVGEEFYEVLDKMIKIRKDKRKIYQDTYLGDTSEFLLSQIKNKIKRIELHLQNKTLNNDIEKAEDNALDIGVYSLFLATNLKKEDIESG
jgi:hypothetical protein